MDTPPSLYFWVSDGCAWIRVVGNADFLNATQLKEFGREMIARGRANDFTVDLTDCGKLDSTFMGTLAGIALRLRELGRKGHVRIVNLQPHHETLLRKLGLDQLFELDAG